METCGFNLNLPSRQSANADMTLYLQALSESAGENLLKLWFINKPV